MQKKKQKQKRQTTSVATNAIAAVLSSLVQTANKQTSYKALRLLQKCFCAFFINVFHICCSFVIHALAREYLRKQMSAKAYVHA